MNAVTTTPRRRLHLSHPSASACIGGVVLCLFFTLLAGCAFDPARGYAAMGVFPADIATVAVPIFENDTFHRDIEFELADALIKEIERRTPYKVTPASRAHTILAGRIRSVEIEPLSRSRLTGLSEEVLLRITVDFKWTDLRTNAVLVERREFTAQALFVPSRPTMEPLEVGKFAVVERLARDIVDELQAPW
jgi:hypothetical protein